MKKIIPFLVLSAAVVALVVMSGHTVSGQTAAPGRLAMFVDMALFSGNNQPRNCFTMNRYKVGEPVGFRITALDPVTGARDRAATLVVHLTYGGKTIDLPMRDRQNEKQPERTFWVAKWIVPDDAPMGVVRYTVSAKDSQGRTGEFKPFDVQTSQITIVE